MEVEPTRQLSALLLILALLVLFPSYASLDFQAKIYDDGTFKLSEHRGKVVVLIFVQTTCSHCRSTLPLIADRWRSDPYLTSGGYLGVIISLSPLHPQTDTGVEDDWNFYQSVNPPNNWILIPEAWDLLNLFDVKYTTTVIVIDPQGNLFRKITPETKPRIDDFVDYVFDSIKQAGNLPENPNEEVKITAVVPSEVYVGQSVKISGSLSPAVDRITIEVRWPSGYSKNYSVLTVDGRFTFSFTPREPGRWAIKIIAGPSSKEYQLTARLMVSLQINQTFKAYYGTFDQEAAEILGLETQKAGTTLPPGNIILLGGPKANHLSKLINQMEGITVENKEGRSYIKVNSYELKTIVSYGKSDYALIYALEYKGRKIILVEGLTRYGTRAGALYLWSGYAAGNTLVIIKWTDYDGNGDVSLQEIKEVYSEV